jgi:hypothetical protein
MRQPIQATAGDNKGRAAGAGTAAGYLGKYGKRDVLVASNKYSIAEFVRRLVEPADRYIMVC